MISFSEFIFKKLGLAIANVFKKILEKVQKFCEFFVKYWWLIIIIVVIVIIGLTVLVFTVNRNNLGKCIEQGESSLTNNTNFVSVLAYPNNNSFFEVQENNYEHEKDGGKMNALSTLLDGTSIKKNNASPIIIEITGSWIPWFGDLVEQDNGGNITSTFQRDIATPNKTELCRFRKKTLGNDEFNGTLQAREYYYLDNYYKDVKFTKIGSNTALEANTNILDPVLQEPCWIEGGTGLYLGFYGVDGNGFPSHFHHLQANEMVCDPENFLRDYNYDTQNSTKIKAITTFNFDYNKFYDGSDYKNISNMSYGDYIYQNFSLNYAKARKEAYENCKNKNNIKTCIDNTIEKERKNFIKTKKDYFLSYKDGYIVYNIRQHEKAMIDAGVEDYPQLVTKAQQAFKDACYYLKKTDDNKGYNVIDAAKYRFKEYFDENKLLADYENNINYKNKEVGKILLLDKYYSDNQGGYNLDFKSGFIVDTTSDKISISSRFKDIEQFLLGTSKPHEDDDRTDGFIYKVYQNILDSGFETIAKAALALFVAIKGLYVILGFTEMKKKDFILFCIRIAFLFSIVDSNGWAFYNKTFINYFVNAVIGFVDLMAQIFNNIYDLVLPSSIVNNSMKIFEKSPTTTNAYEIWRYLTIFDNIFDFLKDPTLHKRIVSLVFVKGNPAIGIIMFLMSYYMLYKFIKAIITSIVPLIIITAQIAILLPLAPIFLVFMFFQRTETYFKNWVKNMASRSFELIVFFFVLFTTTGLINGKIQEFYSFKVCYRHLYSVKNNESAFKKESDLISMNKSKANWILAATQNLVKFVFKTLFGQMVVPIPEGFESTSLLAILMNFLILYFLIFMYSTINSSITQLMTKIFSFKDPQDKNDKGKFENAGSGLVGDKHNKLAPDVFGRLADMGGKGIIEGASSIFSTDDKGKHIPRLSTDNSFLKNISGVFKMGKDAAKKTAGLVNTVSGGVISGGMSSLSQRNLDKYRRTSPFSRFLQRNIQRLDNFINRFEKFTTTGNYREFSRGNQEAGFRNINFKSNKDITKTINKALKNKNLTDKEREEIKELGEITREAINNLTNNAITSLYEMPDDMKKLTKDIIRSIIALNKQGIQMYGITSKSRNKNKDQKVIVDTGLTTRFIKEINKKVQQANELFKQGQIEKFEQEMTLINERFLGRDTLAFINKITQAQENLAKNKFANSSTKTGFVDRLDIYTKLQEHLIEQVNANEKLDLTSANKLLDIFEEIDKKKTPTIDLSNLISKDKFNSHERTKNTRANIWSMAVQELASDLIKDGAINEKAIDRFNYITKKADKVQYTKKGDTFKEIAAIQTALTVDNNYARELNELNKKLKEGNISETEKTEINDRITKIQEIRKSFEKTMIGDNIKEIDKTFERQEILLSQLEAYKSQRITEQRTANTDRIISDLNDKLNNKDITKEEKTAIENKITEVESIKKELKKIEGATPNDKAFERQEMLLNKLETEFGNGQQLDKTSFAHIEREIEKTKERLNTIKALKEQSSKENETLYEKLMKPLEVQTTETEVMLGIHSQETKSGKEIVEDRVKALQRELKATEDEVAKAEIKEELDILKNRDINKLSSLYATKDKFTEKRATAQFDHIERIREANGDENKLQVAEELLKSQEDLIRMQEKVELLRNGDTDVLRAKLSSELKTEADSKRREELKEQIKATDNNNKDELQKLKQEFKTQEKVADRKNEILKSRENRDLAKENKIEVIKERLENEKAALNREAKTATDERRAEIKAKQVKVQNDLNAIGKLEKDVKEGRITTEQSKEQLQKHFEANEKFANTELDAMNLEKVMNSLPKQEKDALNGVVNALNQEISEINANPEQFLAKEKAISELKERAIDIIKQTVEEKNQFDADNILTDNFSMENFAPGTQAEAFTIKLDESAFMVSADAKSFTIVVNDNLYPCQKTEEGTIEIDPMEEQLKESAAILQKANKFNIKMLEYQLEKAKEEAQQKDNSSNINKAKEKVNNLQDKLKEARKKDDKYKKQLNKKVGQ